MRYVYSSINLGTNKRILGIHYGLIDKRWAEIPIRLRLSVGYGTFVLMNKKSVKNVVVKSLRKMVLRKENSFINVLYVKSNLQIRRS